MLDNTSTNITSPDRTVNATNTPFGGVCGGYQFGSRSSGGYIFPSDATHQPFTPNTLRLEDAMWKGDPRTSTAEWRNLRRLVLAASDICHVCGKPGATQVDHVTPLAEGGSPGLDNLAPIHDDPCHRRKSSAEGNRKRWANHHRPQEHHPGLR